MHPDRGFGPVPPGSEFDLHSRRAVVPIRLFRGDVAGISTSNLHLLSAPDWHEGDMFNHAAFPRNDPTLTDLVLGYSGPTIAVFDATKPNGFSTRKRLLDGGRKWLPEL